MYHSINMLEVALTAGGVADSFAPNVQRGGGGGMKDMGPWGGRRGVRERENE